MDLTSLLLPLALTVVVCLPLSVALVALLSRTPVGSFLGLPRAWLPRRPRSGRLTSQDWQHFEMLLAGAPVPQVAQDAQDSPRSVHPPRARTDSPPPGDRSDSSLGLHTLGRPASWPPGRSGSSPARMFFPIMWFTGGVLLMAVAANTLFMLMAPSSSAPALADEARIASLITGQVPAEDTLTRTATVLVDPEAMSAVVMKAVQMGYSMDCTSLPMVCTGSGDGMDITVDSSSELAKVTVTNTSETKPT